MRLKRLDLKAFGHFTERPSLDFNSSEPGLHIIFGANEAGKSSSLRALKILLYGFPRQTPDNFIHNYDKLLVGGCLENSAGEEIIFQRRKKRIGDIINEAGDPLDPGVLSPFLNGVELEIFESLYGIDHDTLVRGGEEILARKGEVGQALFAASAGISSLQKVIYDLKDEALALFKPAGQLPEINKAVKRFSKLQKEFREVSLSSRVWKDYDTSCKKAKAERIRLEKEREKKDKEQQRLDRLNKAIPELDSLKELQKQQSALGKVVLLPSDFPNRSRQAAREMREAYQLLQKNTDYQEKLKQKRQAISFNKYLLSQAEMVDDFHQRLGEYRKGQKDIPVRDGMRISLRREAARLLKQIRPDLNLEQVEILRPQLTRKKTIQALSSQYEAIKQQLTQAQKKVKTIEQEKKDLEKNKVDTLEIKVPLKLVQAVKLAQKIGDIDVKQKKNKADIEMKKEECLLELKQIGLWHGKLATLMELSLPLPETMQQFEKQYSRIADERRELNKDLKKNKKELKTIQIEIKKIMYAGKVPSEEELALIREKREQGWQLIRREWLDKKDITCEILSYDPDQLLPDAYQDYVKKADNLADRLRREADRVANAASLKALKEALQEAVEENDNAMTKLELSAQELQESWLVAWQSSNIIPRSPKEMIRWLDKIDKLRFKVADLFKKEQESVWDEQHRKDLNQNLQQELNFIGEKQIPVSEELGPVLIFAQTVLEKIAREKSDFEKFMEKQKQIQKAEFHAKEDLNAAIEALARWQKKWQKAFLDLGHNGEISTLEAVDIIEMLQNCFDKLKEAEDLEKRIAGIKRDAIQLETEVKILLDKVAPDIIDLPLDQAILKLRTMLGQAQKDSIVYDKLSEQIDSLQEEVFTSRKILLSAKKHMNKFLGMAECEKPEELETIIIRCMEYQRLKEKISDTRVNLARIGAYVKPEEIERQAAVVDADKLPGRIESLRRDIRERIDPQIKEISQKIGAITASLAAMDGSARAAEIAEKKQEELARIRRLAERYSLLKLAARILHKEIERYREEHQDPVLKIASRYFKDLTMGSFAGLRTDVDDKGGLVLVGVRPDNQRLTVDKMSSGTHDQLFLALRLASLELRLEKNEPMPFIVDDILINFDDDRAHATLKVLADLSRKNQVILFTHHRKIVEQAKTIKKDRVIKIHEL